MKPSERLPQHHRADHHNTISPTICCGVAKSPSLTVSLEDPEDLGAGDGTDLSDAIRVTKDHTDLQRQEKSKKNVERQEGGFKVGLFVFRQASHHTDARKAPDPSDDESDAVSTTQSTNTGGGGGKATRVGNTYPTCRNTSRQSEYCSASTRWVGDSWRPCKETWLRRNKQHQKRRTWQSNTPFIYVPNEKLPRLAVASREPYAFTFHLSHTRKRGFKRGAAQR